jgi:hypothetical protein
MKGETAMADQLQEIKKTSLWGAGAGAGAGDGDGDADAEAKPKPNSRAIAAYLTQRERDLVERLWLGPMGAPQRNHHAHTHTGKW